MQAKQSREWRAYLIPAHGDNSAFPVQDRAPPSNPLTLLASPVQRPTAPSAHFSPEACPETELRRLRRWIFNFECSLLCRIASIAHLPVGLWLAVWLTLGSWDT